MKKNLTGMLLFLLFCISLPAQELYKASLNIQVDKPGINVSPDLYGIFFEEINLAGDGGIYPELIRNCSFEFNKEKPEFWILGAQDAAKGEMKLEKSDAGSEFNQTSLRIDSESESGHLSVINEGYWGVPVEKGKPYNIVIRAKASDDFAGGDLLCKIESADGKSILGITKAEKLDSNWKTYQLQIKSDQSDPKARFSLSPVGNKGTLWLDYVSLKPAQTFNGHGLRQDLMEKLAALKPAFVRFPGGCWVEGDTMQTASRWKRTIGPEMDRWTQPNIWGYQSTNGLGYHEYLQLCEDLGAAAMFVINCGMSHKENVPMDKMDEYVQDALDAIEYANGQADSKWGKIRAEKGHPEPFHLKYMEIGNENGGPAYWERYDLFYTKIHEKYPEIKIVACQWSGKVTNQKPIEIHDEHYYNDPAFFVKNAHRYDSYDRHGKKIYVGEYAVTKKCGLGNLDAAIGEAAFMTGMEKNSDVVLLSSYAPLFVNVNHRRWNPDMIVFDGTRSYGTPSYYVQQLFSNHRSEVIVSSTVQLEPRTPVNGGSAISGSVGVGSWLTKVEYKDAKVIKNGQTIFESKLDKAPEKGVKSAGDWKFAEGVLRQENASLTDCRYTFGEDNGNNYTFSVKARKIEGKEGFLILFNVRKDGHYAWLNIGGWGNTATGIEEGSQSGAIGGTCNFTVESHRWYDIRLEQHGNHVQCFIDDKLILRRDLSSHITDGIFAVTGLNESKETLIIKVVNTASEPCETAFSLDGVTKISSSVTEIVLTSENALDENTLDYPEKISPNQSAFPVNSPKFTRTLPAKSVTVLRIGVK